MSTIGTVSKTNSGSYRGTLQMLSIKAAISILPNEDKTHEKQPDFRVIAKNGYELGAGWTRKNRDGEEYVSLSLASPEFPGGRIFANLGRAAGTRDEDETYAVIWNPPSRN